MLQTHHIDSMLVQCARVCYQLIWHMRTAGSAKCYDPITCLRLYTEANVLAHQIASDACVYLLPVRLVMSISTPVVSPRLSVWNIDPHTSTLEQWQNLLISCPSQCFIRSSVEQSTFGSKILSDIQAASAHAIVIISSRDSLTRLLVLREPRRIHDP